MIKTCPICANECSELHVKHPFFWHMDYSTVSKGANLIKCVECQTISNPDAVKIGIVECVVSKV